MTIYDITGLHLLSSHFHDYRAGRCKLLEAFITFVSCDGLQLAVTSTVP